MTYLDLLQTLDAWFASGAEAAGPGVVPCRTGCTGCCHGPFDISAADARLVAGAVDRLPHAVADGVRSRARQQLVAGTTIDPRWQPPYRPIELGDDAFDALCDAQQELPCPALDPMTGACLIHDFRPATCRMMGLSMALPEGDLLENGCPIQDRFPGYQALAATPFDLMRFELTAAEHDLAAIDAGWHSTTVAGTVVTLSSR